MWQVYTSPSGAMLDPLLADLFVNVAINKSYLVLPTDVVIIFCTILVISSIPNTGRKLNTRHLIISDIHWTTLQYSSGEKHYKMQLQHVQSLLKLFLIKIKGIYIYIYVFHNWLKSIIKRGLFYENVWIIYALSTANPFWKFPNRIENQWASLDYIKNWYQ